MKYSRGSALAGSDPGKSLNERVRKFRLRTFRYNVIYVIDELEIIVVAAEHHRRRPGYWHSRLTLLR